MDVEVVYVSPHVFVTLFIGLYGEVFEDAFPGKKMVYRDMLDYVEKTRRGGICLPGLMIHPEGTPTND